MRYTSTTPRVCVGGVGRTYARADNGTASSAAAPARANTQANTQKRRLDTTRTRLRERGKYLGAVGTCCNAQPGVGGPGNHRAHRSLVSGVQDLPHKTIKIINNKPAGACTASPAHAAGAQHSPHTCPTRRRPGEAHVRHGDKPGRTSATWPRLRVGPQALRCKGEGEAVCRAGGSAPPPPPRARPVPGHTARTSSLGTGARSS